MSSIGYTIFGRPVQHEYVSNGLFNELNLNNESYLSDRIDLKKGQTLAILKRYKDQNGVEITAIFLNTFAESYNERPGGFVGAGIAFIGKPSTTLIYQRLKQLHQQSLKLVEDKTFKFKISKLDSDQIQLPDLSEDGLFISRKPKNYSAKDSVIGVSFSGSFYENLMSVIQGFCFNPTYFGVKTAFVANSENLLKSLDSVKSIYQIYNLLDYSYVFKKQSKDLTDKKNKIEEEIIAKKQRFKKEIIEKERELVDREEKLNNEKTHLLKRENVIKELEKNKNTYENQITSLTKDRNKLSEYNKAIQEKIRNLKLVENELTQNNHQIKNDSFQNVINSQIFQKEKESYEDNLKQEFEKERLKNRKTDWIKVLFGLMSLGFLILSITLFYLLHKNKLDLRITNDKLSLKTNLVNKLESEKKLNKLPIELSANEFLKLDNEKKADHKLALKESIEFITDQNNNKTVRNDITNLLLDRKWNFREILYDNVPNKIMGGLSVLDILKNKSNAKENDLLNSPFFLLEELRNNELKEKKIKLKEELSYADFLSEYLKQENNIYDKLGVKYFKPEDGQTYQDSDPVLLMHFRWMIYNYKDQKKDIKEYNKGDEIKVPILK